MKLNAPIVFSFLDEECTIDFGCKISNYTQTMFGAGTSLLNPFKFTKLEIKDIKREIKYPVLSFDEECTESYFSLQVISFQIGPLGVQIVNSILGITGIEEMIISPYRIQLLKAPLFTWNDMSPLLQKAIDMAFRNYYLEFKKSKNNIEMRKKRSLLIKKRWKLKKQSKKLIESVLCDIKWSKLLAK